MGTIARINLLPWRAQHSQRQASTISFGLVQGDFD